MRCRQSVWSYDIIEDITWSAKTLCCWSFNHVCRQSNSIAHVLARKTKDIDSLKVWLNDILDDISHFVLKDIHLFNKIGFD
jgi:hypothetical protein